MAYFIGDTCLKCGACEAGCENKAISEQDIYTIDPARCTECVGNAISPMCVEVCPVGAPNPDPNNKESREQLLKKWNRLHPGQKPKL